MAEGAERKCAALPPNSVIGIVGGGQLGRMLASSAAKLGFRTIVLDPQEGCPAAQTCSKQIVAPYDDFKALDELAALCDVVTYEFENVPLVAAHRLQGTVSLFPPAKALEVAQDRLVEKKFLQETKIEVAAYYPIDKGDDLLAALQDLDGGILKTRRLGYDGKGQYRFSGAEPPVAETVNVVLAEMGAREGPADCVLEQIVPFEREFSIIATRAQDGEVAHFDPAENTHEDGILRRSAVPAFIRQDSLEAGRLAVTRILEAIDYVGTIGVEFFETAEGILVNEIAPRVHNTGHWTEEACQVSQFEQHIRAIAGLPLGSVARHFDCEMINLLGSEGSQVDGLLKDQTAHVTLYGKADAKPGRKMGHVTRLRERV